MPRPKGQITRLKNGVWQMRVQRCVNGTRKSVSKRYVTRKDAEDALESLFDDLAKPAPGFHTGKQLFDNYLFIIKPHIKQQTYEFYEQIITKHLRDEFDALPLTEFTPFKLESFFATKRGAMAGKAFRVLKSCLRRAIIWDWLLKNPLDEIKPPKSIAKKKEVLEIDEVNLFLSACPADQYALWSFVTLTGCRISEALGAKWANLDYDKSIFKVREVLVRTKTGKKFDEPKTVNSIRDVPLSSDLISILKKHKVEQNKRRLRVGSLWHDNDLIFPSRFGKPKSAVKCAEQLKKIVSDAGIKKNVSPHTLRHGFVTLAIDSGADIKTVSEMVGHSSVAITMQIYKQTKFSDKRTVATAMSDMILKWAKNVRTESNETVKSMTEKDENQPKPLKKAAETG